MLYFNDGKASISAAAHSKAVIRLLLGHCLMLPLCGPLGMVGPGVCFVVLCVISSLTIISQRKREVVALLYMYFSLLDGCLYSVYLSHLLSFANNCTLKLS